MAGLIASEEACEVVRDMEIEVLYTENVQSRSKIIGKLYNAMQQYINCTFHVGKTHSYIYSYLICNSQKEAAST